MKNQFILTPYFIDSPLEELLQLVQPEYWWVNDPELPVGTPQDRLVELYLSLKEHVARAIDEGRRPISIAGDCCTTLGVLSGLQTAGIDPALLWFDAHGDFNTWETTPSGFLGGMPLAMLVGRGEQTIVKGIGLDTIKESAVILSDARDLDPGEKLLLEGSEIVHYSHLSDLFDIKLPQRPLYVHFDTDVIDPKDAPAMNYLAANGPSLEMMGRVFGRLAESEGVAAVSVSTWNPVLDGDGQTEATVLSLLKILIGQSITRES